MAVADMSREESKRLRAELAEGLGYTSESGPEDVAGYREQIAKRKVREQAGERDGWELGGYKRHKWDHLKEEMRRAEVEARGPPRWPTSTSERHRRD